MNRFIILLYHMIAEAKSPKEVKYCCTPRNFGKQMKYLRKAGYSPIELGTVLAFLVGKGSLPTRAFAVTFDDGFMNFYHNAFPILQEYTIPATVFVVSDLVGKTNEWMQKREFPHRELMGWREIHQLCEAGISIGSHTASHPRLTEISEKAMREELRRSKQFLEDRVGKEVPFFAYPYGLFNEQVERAVAESGYSAACSTRSGFNSSRTEFHSLRRIEVYGSDPLWKFSQKLKFGVNDASLSLPAKYYFSRICARLP